MFELLNALLGHQSGHDWERSATGELVRVTENKRLIVYKHRFDGGYRYCIQDNRYDFRDSVYSERGFISEAEAVEACEKAFYGAHVESFA